MPEEADTGFDITAIIAGIAVNAAIKAIEELGGETEAVEEMRQIAQRADMKDKLRTTITREVRKGLMSADNGGQP